MRKSQRNIAVSMISKAKGSLRISEKKLARLNTSLILLSIDTMFLRISSNAFPDVQYFASLRSYGLGQSQIFLG